MVLELILGHTSGYVQICLDWEVRARGFCGIYSKHLLEVTSN